MAKFKDKKTKKIIEESLGWYINLLRNNPCYEEIKEKNEEHNSIEIVNNNQENHTESNSKREE